MPIKDHPDYPEEQNQLTGTIQHIETRLAGNPREDTHGGDRYANRALRQQNMLTAQELQDARREPYFGRVDWQPVDSSEIEATYFGKVLIRERRIYSWQSEAAKNLFYLGQADTSSGRRLRKRTLLISGDEITHIADVYSDAQSTAQLRAALAARPGVGAPPIVAPPGVAPVVTPTPQAATPPRPPQLLRPETSRPPVPVPPVPPVTTPPMPVPPVPPATTPPNAARPELITEPPPTAADYTDAFLLRLLSDTRDGRLRDFVATIQAQQYEIIQAPYAGMLVIQGAPGSGKTSLALHRISYLLYHHSAQLRRLLILGPNRMFLGYIANVLPALGERHIPQRTFDEWTVDMLGEGIEYSPQEQALEWLMNATVPVTDRVLQYRAARLKSSPAMADLLDHYVADLQADVLAGKGRLTCTFTYTLRPDSRTRLPVREEAGRSPDQIRHSVAEVAKLPFNQRRAAVEDRLITELHTELRTRVRDLLAAQQLSTVEAESPELTTALTAQIRTHVHAYFDRWNALNVALAYRRLLTTPALLQRAGAAVVAPPDLEALALAAPRPRQPYDFSDLAALLYLKLRLVGPGADVYDHIVVDEAQDITPLHFRVLQEYSRGSLTVLGDVDQGIYAQYSIQQWTDLAPAGAATPDVPPVRWATIRESYRSTHAIIEYANQLLQRVGVPDDHLAQPVARRGQPPTEHGFPAGGPWATGIGALVAQAQQAGHRSIAVVCKTVAGCQILAAHLTAIRFPPYQQLLDRDSAYEGGLVLMPAYLTKGLEFDTVIVADADAMTYPADALAVRLLYVALTRAAHRLHICWVGSRSPLLDPALPRVALAPLLQGRLDLQPVTIADFVAEPDSGSADAAVQRLARTRKLPLLLDGTLDRTLLDLLLREPSRAPESVS